jgi:hypothetical protein
MVLLLYGGADPTPARIASAVLVGVLVVIAARAGWGPTAAGALLLVVALGYAIVVQPRQDRAWSEDQSRLPRVALDGDRVTIDDFRTFRYRAVDDWDARWTTRTYDLSGLVGADLGIERFSAIEAVAHTFVRFRFASGPALVASIEIRKEQGEAFDPFRGMLRHYEKMVVLGDEEDLIDLRVHHRRSDVVLYPLHIETPRVRAFLRSILTEARQLETAPVHYHTVLASCSTSLARHIRAVEPVPWDLRMVLPGYADALAHELGWLGPEALDELQSRHRLR